MSQLVSEIGEEGLLRRVRERLGSGAPGEVWAGDDAAVIRVPRDRMLFATDFMVEDVDFSLAYAAGADVGFKAVAINVSDMAAMGGFPLHAVASVSLRPDVEVAFFDSLLDGLVDAAKEWRVSIVGGDISSATEVMVSVAMTGACDEEPILRSGASPGEAICVTGTLGASAAGLFALQHELRGSHHGIDGLIRRHLRPRARVLEGLRLAKVGATAMIDVSDGLALDLKRLMTASGTGCIVEPATIPVDPAIGEMATLVGESPEPLDLAVRGGEDYELLFTIGRERYPDAKLMVGELGTQVTAIGEVTDGPMRIGDMDLKGKDLGWDHLRNR
jgi:thiamine-monophosphate kinase